MRGIRYLGGLAVLGSALAAWAWAQSSGHLPPSTEAASEPPATTLPTMTAPAQSAPPTGSPMPSQPTTGTDSSAAEKPAMPSTGTPSTGSPSTGSATTGSTGSAATPGQGVYGERLSAPAVAPQARPVAAADGGEEQDAGTANKDNPTGRQEPAVSIEWIGPPSRRSGARPTTPSSSATSATSPFSKSWFASVFLQA